MPALTADPISAARMEESIGKLWDEFLKRYFNAADHTVGGEVLAFPAAEIRMQGRPTSQPHDGVSIMVTWAMPSYMRRCWETVEDETQEMIHARMTFMFWIRAAGAFADGTNARYRAQQTADRLYAVMCNSAETRDLSARGIQRIRTRIPQLVANGPQAPGASDAKDYEMRLMMVAATLRYAVLSQ